MTHETVSRRVQRAKSQDMELTIVETDPVVVQVDSEASDQTHMVVPESIQCSCEEEGYFCTHQIVVLDSGDHPGELLRDALAKEKNDCFVERSEINDKIEELEDEREIEELEAKQDELADRADRITDLLNELDLDQSMNSTKEDAIEMLQMRDPVYEDSQELAEMKAELLADNEDEFEELVAKFTGEE